MASSPVFWMRIKTDEDWMALTVYRQVLREILENLPYTEAATVAQAALEAFGDDVDADA